MSLVHPFETLMNTSSTGSAATCFGRTSRRPGSGWWWGRWRPWSSTTAGSLDVDTVVLSVGARPRVDLARASDLEVDRGVLIDDRLRTSDPNVYAIGDCAQHKGAGFGLVGPGWDRALVLADLLTGDRAARHRGSTTYARLKAAGVEVASLGLLEVEVCNCNHVTEPTIVAAIADGCSTIADLKRETRAGTGCGSCTAALAD